MELSRFDRDTAIAAVDSGFTASIDRGWWIVLGPNGGYLAAILLRAALAVAGDDRLPITLTIHYLRPPAEGDAFLEAEIVREGRTVTSVITRLSQQGRLIAFATAALTAPRDGVMEFCDLAPPSVPAPEECPPWPTAAAPEALVPIGERYETRPAIGDPPFSGSDRAESGGWIRTEDARGIDALLLTALTDAWVPALFTRQRERNTAVPTVELSVYFRDPSPRPTGEWALVNFRSQVAAGGYVEEDGEIWSQDGALLVQSRQLAVLMPMEPTG